MSDYEVIDRERVLWGEQFAGGMIPFDNAYWSALNNGAVEAVAQRDGVDAVLDAFCERLKSALAERSSS